MVLHCSRSTELIHGPEPQKEMVYHEEAVSNPSLLYVFPGSVTLVFQVLDMSESQPMGRRATKERCSW